MNREQSRADQVIALAALAFLLIGCFLVVRPFLSAIVWAAILASATWPIYLRVESALGGRRGLAAGVVTLLSVVVLLAPFYFVWQSLADTRDDLVDLIRETFVNGLPDPPQWLAGIPFVGESATNYWRGLTHDRVRLGLEGKKLFDVIRPTLLAVGINIGQGILELTFSVFIAFFFYRDGRRAAAQGRAIFQRLAGDRALLLITEAHSTIIGVVYGVLGTALAQGIIAGIGFAIARVPGAALLGFMTFIFAIAPLGPMIVWVPVMIWLFIKGSTGWAIFMLVWGLIVSSTDNVLRPLIISRGSNLSFIMILIGVIGGAFAFGFLGVFLGPTVLAVTLRLMYEWTNAPPEPALTVPRKKKGT